ncbi:hypothetical protein EAH89_19560 [Roseomonas nepalensis]|uniref:Uncharacterized protein n=1 Tax=Muricoccus nepalensis TaxID=1854500 RepID=A0A502FQV9_9PROT|nr:hypothetical protein EAH89_19560 [Roseomonas nepalensis]
MTTGKQLREIGREPYPPATPGRVWIVELTYSAGGPPTGELRTGTCSSAERLARDMLNPSRPLPPGFPRPIRAVVRRGSGSTDPGRTFLPGQQRPMDTSGPAQGPLAPPGRLASVWRALRDF